jgi:ubiquinone/menaquinone biosynthesis C-methylase UbiE
MQDTSWQKVGKWYDSLVGKQGHFYHREVILPNLWRLLGLKDKDNLLDIGCGQGILGRMISGNYTGIDLAVNLIEEARRLDKNSRHKYLVADATKKLNLSYFDKITMILSLQNIAKPFLVFKNCQELLNKNGRLYIVINHPCFRIPKHSDWKTINEKQYRIIDKYLIPTEIPIESSPFDRINNEISLSFHYPLSAYSQMLLENGLVIEKIVEWISPKKSTGKMAKIEDTARAEFPLFMALIIKKL